MFFCKEEAYMVVFGKIFVIPLQIIVIPLQMILVQTICFWKAHNITYNQT